MDTEKIFSKLNSRDYNNQLEKILENKDYSVTVKNLLLSMLYKIESGYKDYSIVKRIVHDKKTYIENILRIIKEKCEKIIIVEDGSKEAKELQEEGRKFYINSLENTIYLMYPNESLLLYTLYKIDNKQIYLDEKYNLIRNALSNLLNAGEDINNIEVLRDFNGWNWNIVNREIPEITTNIIYQNLIYLLGIEFIKRITHTQEIIDYIKLMKEKLIEVYKEENAREILNQIYKISIIICTQKNEAEKKRLLEEREILEKELDRLKDKIKLSNDISNIKKESLKRIKQIDNILNNKNLLEEEYVKRNEKRATYNKIFSISHLTEILNKERNKELKIIEENNLLLDPKHYVQTVCNLEKQLELLKDIGDNKQEENKYKYVINLQKVFIKCFYIKIENAKEKEEIINLLYMLRYYNLIFITQTEQIKDTKELKKDLNDIEKNLIKKAYDLKVLNIITNEIEVNDEIIINILKTKIISLENIGIELKQTEENLEVNIYDGNVFEKTIIIPKFNQKSLQIKFGKITRIFKNINI